MKISVSVVNSVISFYSSVRERLDQQVHGIIEVKFMRKQVAENLVWFSSV